MYPMAILEGLLSSRVAIQVNQVKCNTIMLEKSHLKFQIYITHMFCFSIMYVHEITQIFPHLVKKDTK